MCPRLTAPCELGCLRSRKNCGNLGFDVGLQIEDGRFVLPEDAVSIARE